MVLFTMSTIGSSHTLAVSKANVLLVTELAGCSLYRGPFAAIHLLWMSIALSLGSPYMQATLDKWGYD
jgi:hypothetical protein